MPQRHRHPVERPTGVGSVRGRVRSRLSFPEKPICEGYEDL